MKLLDIIFDTDEKCSNHHFDRSKTDGTVLKFTGGEDKTYVFVKKSMTCMHENCSETKTSTTRMYTKDMSIEDVLENIETDADQEVFNLEH